MAIIGYLNCHIFSISAKTIFIIVWFESGLFILFFGEFGASLLEIENRPRYFFLSCTAILTAQPQSVVSTELFFARFCLNNRIPAVLDDSLQLSVNSRCRKSFTKGKTNNTRQSRKTSQTYFSTSRTIVSALRNEIIITVLNRFGSSCIPEVPQKLLPIDIVRSSCLKLISAFEFRVNDKIHVSVLRHHYFVAPAKKTSPFPRGKYSRFRIVFHVSFAFPNE